MRRALALFPILLLGCPKPPETAAPAPAATPAPAAPKRVILFIGDGMGPGQVGLLQLYATRAPSGAYGGGPTAFDRLADAGTLGISMHAPADRLVVDSACSATQLATGVPTLNEVIGVGPEGQALETVLERAEAQGKATGLVSDTRITHATPAAFAAHVGHREQENDIALQLVDSGVDVLMSGGRRHFLPSEQGGKRDDGRDLLVEAQGAGWNLVDDLAGLEGARTPLLGLFAMSGMLDGIHDHATRGTPHRTEPTLLEMTQTAVDLLDDDEDGFFLMVEAGQIDWAGHANDAGWMLHEMHKADETLHWLLDYAEANPDVLLVVTADHETGGFGFSYSRANLPNEPQARGGVFTRDNPYQPDWYFGAEDGLDRLWAQADTFSNVLYAFGREQDQSPARLAEMVNEVSAFSLTEAGAARVLASEPNHFHVADHKTLSAGTFPEFHDFEAFYPYGEGGRSGLIARELAAESSVVWSTGTHTHIPVPVFAVGPGAEDFGALLHHTEIGGLLMAAVTP